MRRIVPMGALEEYRDPSGTVVLAEVHVGEGWVGHLVTAVERASGARVAFVTRYGEGLVPMSDTVVQEGDLVHALYRVDDRDRVERVFAEGPEAF